MRKKKDELTSDELETGRDDIAEVEAVNTIKNNKILRTSQTP